MGSIVIPDLWNLNAALVILFFTLLSLFLFYLIDRNRMQRQDKMAD